MKLLLNFKDAEAINSAETLLGKFAFPHGPRSTPESEALKELAHAALESWLEDGEQLTAVFDVEAGTLTIPTHLERRAMCAQAKAKAQGQP